MIYIYILCGLFDVVGVWVKTSVLFVFSRSG